MGNYEASREPLVVAGDLGGTNCRLALVDRAGRIKDRQTMPTPKGQGRSRLLAELSAAILRLAAPVTEMVQAVGLGIPAQLRPESGYVYRAPNLPELDGCSLAAELGQRLPWPVVLENDANLFALGEWFRGAGQGQDHLLGITLGTGVGGGLILQGRLWQGPRGTAAEIGHLVIDPAGALCSCGNRGCLETVASATWTMAWTKARLKEGAASSLRAAWEREPASLTALELAAAAAAGDELARQAFQRVGQALGIAIVDVIHLLGLPLVVIGGKFARAWPHFFPALAQELQHRLTFFRREELQILPAALGDEAGLLGAARLAWEAVS